MVLVLYSYYSYFYYNGCINNLLDFFTNAINLYYVSPFIPAILVFKILILCVFAIGTRGTVPRYRLDQLTQLNWKYFIFVWLIFTVFSIFIFIIWA